MFETRNGIGQKYSIYYAPVEEDGTPVTDISKMTLLKTGTGLSFMICDGKAEDLSSEHTIVSIKVSTQD